MNLPTLNPTRGLLIEEKRWFTLVELSRACRTDRSLVVALVEEGVVVPGDAGSAPDSRGLFAPRLGNARDQERWRFDGDALRRARTALRLARDLELSLAGVALALDLLDEIDRLRARLQRSGER